MRLRSLSRLPILRFPSAAFFPVGLTSDLWPLTLCFPADLLQPGFQLKLILSFLLNSHRDANPANSAAFIPSV